MEELTAVPKWNIAMMRHSEIPAALAAHPQLIYLLPAAAIACEAQDSTDI